MKIKHLTLLLSLLVSFTDVTGQVKVTASIDSTVMEMGSRTNISINIVDPDKRGMLVNLPVEDSNIEAYDVVSVSTDTIPSGYKYDILIQAFYPGMVTIPPFQYVVGKDTTESDILTLKVLPVALDSLTTINPMESVINPPRKWYDYNPDWIVWIVLGIALIILSAAAVYYYIQYRKTGSILLQKPKPVDPYERAMSELAHLRERKLAETGKEKEYYTALVDILRQYLQGRFSINAMEMSSTQILTSLRNNPETRDNQQRIKQILEIADFVKFAKVRPLPDDNIKSYNNVQYFVESTKPVPVEESVEANDNKDNQSETK